MSAKRSKRRQRQRYALRLWHEVSAGREVASPPAAARSRIGSPRALRRHGAQLILAALTAGVAGALGPAKPVCGAINNWKTNQVIAGTESITPGPGIDLSLWNTAGHNLRFAELASLDLHGSDFSASRLDSAHFKSANLSSAVLTSTNLTSADLTSADLTGAQVTYADFSQATYTGFTAGQLYATASYQNHDLTGIGLSFNNLPVINLANQNLTSSNLGGAILNSGDLISANLTGANLSFASFLQVNMSGANLSGANLTGAFLNSSNLTGASLAGATLTLADLSLVNLTSANLVGANLVGADLGGVTWTGASLDLVDLRHATGFNYQTCVASMRGTIHPDGTVDGFALNSGETWLVRPDSLAVTVDGAVQVASASEVQINGSVVGIQSSKSSNWTVASGGKVTLVTGGTAVLRVSALQLSGGPGAWTSKLDVDDNKVILDNANSAMDAATYTNTVSQIKQGSHFDPTANGGDGAFLWDGQGITSTKVNTEQNVNGNFVTLGVLNNDDGTGAPAFYHDGTDLPKFAGQTVNGTAVLVKYTYNGDADLSGTVDSVDFALFRFGFLHPGGTAGGWMNGDFNYDGVIDSVDFALFRFAFLHQGAPLAEAGGGSTSPTRGPGAVPEPASLVLLGLGGLLMLKRRNHKI